MSERWVDVSHEALIRGWPRLRRWIEEDRAGLRLHRRITEAALEWDKMGRDPGALYRGARLSQAVEWWQANEASLNDLERAFLDAGTALERHEKKVRERLRRRVILGLSVALAIFVVLAGWAVQQWRQADRRGEISLARQLAAQADFLSGQRAMLSLRLALAAEAMRRMRAVDDHSLEVDTTLRRELVLSPRHVARFPVEVSGRFLSDVHLSPDGRYLIVGNYSSNIASVWEIATSKKVAHIEAEGKRALIATVHGHEPVRFEMGSRIAGLSAAGKVLATVNYDDSAQVVQVWEADTGRELLSLNLNPDDYNEYALSHDGKYLAVSTAPDLDDIAQVLSEEITRVWDIKSRRQIPGSVPGSVEDFSRDARFFTTSKGFWEVAEGLPRAVQVADDDAKVKKVWKETLSAGLARFVRSTVVKPSGRVLVAAEAEADTMDVWELGPEGSAVIAAEHNGTVMTAGLTPQGRLTTITKNGKKLIARTWDLNTGQEKTDLAVEIEGTGAAFAPDGLSYVVMGDSGLEVRRVGEPQPVTKLAYASPKLIAWSPDGRYLAAATEREARVWDLDSRQSVGQLALPKHPTLLALARGGSSLAAVIVSGDRMPGGVLHQAKLWNVSSGEQLKSFEPTKLWNVSSGEELKSFGPGERRSPQPCGLDARYLVTEDLGVLEMKSGTVRFLVLYQPVSDCVFSSDGRYLAAKSHQGMRLWELRSGKESFRIPTQGGAPLVFDQESRYVATISEENTVRVWSLRQDDLLAEACRRLPQNLSEEEWRQYVGDEPYRKTCPELP